MRPALLRLRRFGRAAEGVVAIEFAFLALPFLFMIFALLELAIVFLLAAALDTGMERAARSIRTGGFQSTNASASLEVQKQAFEAEVCRQMAWIAPSCPSSFTVDVQVVDQWVKTNAAEPFIQDVKDAENKVIGKTFNPNLTIFNTGGPRSIVLVRGYYRWPMLTPLLSQAVVNLQGNKALITSTQAFRNEPYAASTSPSP
jgi:Flp pilus assembly protein TadG